MSAQPAEDDSYRSFTIDLDTGVATRGIWLCIAQLPSRTTEEILSDAECPRNVEILKETLATNAAELPSILRKHAQPDQLEVLVCPEYAFGTADWVQVDELIKTYPNPIVLIAGFGQSSLEHLQAIRESAASRDVSLKSGWGEEPPGGGRAMNFGCVWVKKGDHSREAILYGKNFLEARVEDPQGVFKFNRLTEIVFNDLRVLPFICADILESPRAGGQPTVAQRLARRVTTNHTPALCVGSLLQMDKQASETWVKAIDGLFYAFGDAKASLIIANVATQNYDVRAGGIEWRNLSGIYVSKRNQMRGQTGAQESTSYFESANLMAWPLRSRLPQLAFGTVSLPPYTVDSGVFHPWSASPRDRCTIVLEDSPRVRTYVRTGLQDELFLLSEITNCTVNGNALRFLHVSTHLETQSNTFGDALVSHLLDGPLLRTPKHWRASEISKKDQAALRTCLSCLDALMDGSVRETSADKQFSWFQEISPVGEVVRLGSRQIPVAMWVSTHNSTAQMLTHLRDRANNYSGAVLRLFGRGTDGDIVTENWEAMCIDTTIASDPTVAASETEQSYPDLSTSGAASIGDSLKPRGLQSLISLVNFRTDGSPEDFVKEYEDVVRILQS